MKKIFVILFNLLFLFANSQEDSLSIIYNGGITDTNQVKKLGDYILCNTDELDTTVSFKYLNEAYQFSKENNWKRGIFLVSIKKAFVYLEVEKQEKAVQIVEEYLSTQSLKYREDTTLYKESNYLLSKIIESKRGNNNFIVDDDYALEQRKYLDKSIALIDTNNPKDFLDGWIYYQYATTYTNETKYDKAIGYYSKAIDVFLKLNKLTSAGDCYGDIGNLYYYQNKFSAALENYAIGLDLYVKENDTIGIANTNLNLGNIYKDLDEYSPAISHYETALKLYTQIEDSNSIGTVYNNMGIPYQNLKDYDKAIAFYKKSIAIKEKSNDKKGLGQSYNNIGDVKLFQKKYRESIVYLEKALDYSKAVNDLFTVAIELVNLGEAWGYLGEEEKSLSFYKEGITLCEQLNMMLIKKEAYEDLSLIYESKGDHKQALIYYKLMKTVNDSINDIQKQNHLNTLISEVELEQKNVEVKLLEDQKRIEKTANDKIIKQKKKENVYLLLGIVLLLVLGAVLLFAFYQKRRTNKTLEEQKSLLEEQNQQILTSLEYANSMEKLLVQQMNPHFIFNALTTIQAFVTSNDLTLADKFLRIFANLLRKTLENSRKDSISLEEEIVFLKQYTDLQQLKLNEELSVEFNYDEDEVGDFVNTPPMLIQPFVENAFLHGLRHKTTGEKTLTISIDVKEDFILWVIEDNGVGRSAAALIKESHKKKSYGTTITNDRIKWMKNIYKQNFDIQYEDLHPGTRVTLKTPIVS